MRVVNKRLAFSAGQHGGAKPPPGMDGGFMGEEPVRRCDRSPAIVGLKRALDAANVDGCIT
jgi:hypothetical protein